MKYLPIFKTSGWVKTKLFKCQTGAILDALGAAINSFTRTDADLSLSDIQVLLATGTLAGPHDWVELKDVKAKLKNISDYQFSRHVKALTGKKGILPSPNGSIALIETQQSPSSGREKQIRMTNEGNIMLQRAIQSLTNGLSHAAKERKCDLRIVAEDKSGEEIKIEVANLIISGQTGTPKTTLALHLVCQAIIQGSLVIWLSPHKDKSVETNINEIASITLRENSICINEDPKKHDEVFGNVLKNNGICIQYIESEIGLQNELKINLEMLSNNIKKYEDGNSKHVLIVINNCGDAKQFGTETMRFISDLTKRGCTIHILDQGENALSNAEFEKSEFKNVVFRQPESNFNTASETISSDNKLGEFKIIGSKSFTESYAMKLTFKTY